MTVSGMGGGGVGVVAKIKMLQVLVVDLLGLGEGRGGEGRGGEGRGGEAEQEGRGAESNRG